LQREIPLRGYTLLVASSAHDAIQRTGQLKASVLIVDARIADMDVRDLVMQLRENSAMQRLPVIVVGMTRLARSDVEFYRNFGIFYHSLPWGSNEIAHALAMAVRGKLR
jgi:CheY-like chemotaxis protein